MKKTNERSVVSLDLLSRRRVIPLFLLMLGFLLVDIGWLHSEPLLPKDRKRVIAAVDREQDSEKKIRILLLLVQNSHEEGKREQELTFRNHLHKYLKEVGGNEKLMIANLHELGKIRFEKGSLREAEKNFSELLQLLPVNEVKTRYLVLQYLSTISAKLQKTTEQENYLAKYVMSKSKTSEFYTTSGGFADLIALTEKNRSGNHHHYYANWYDVATLNGSLEDQKRILTQWVNYTTEKKEHFSEKPFEAYSNFLLSQGQEGELRDLQLLYAQNTTEHQKKVQIYEQIHQQNQTEGKETDLGLLTFLYEHYDRNNLIPKKLEILQILSYRADYPHKVSALKELAVISLKNEDLLLSFNTHRDLYKEIDQIRTKEDLVILNNLISLSQQLSKDEYYVQYLKLKALNPSSVIQKKDKHHAFNLLLDHHDKNLQYDELFSFYQTFVEKGVLAKGYKDGYKIHFSVAMLAEKTARFDLALELYNLSFDLGIESQGSQPEFIKISQRVLQLTEKHHPGAEEFEVLKKMRRLYAKIPDLKGVAKTDLITAQKYQKNQNTKEAVKAYNTALQSYRKIEDQEQVSQILTLLANLEESDTGAKLARLKDLESSLEKSQKTENLIKVRVELGNYYKIQQDLIKAKDYYLKAFNTEEGNKSYLSLEAGYFSALILSNMGESQPANELITEIVGYTLPLNQQDVIANAYQLLAKNQNSAGLQKEALENINKALTIGIESLEASLLLTKCAILISNKMFAEALKAKQLLSGKSLPPEDQLTLYLHGTKAYIGLQDYEAANREVNLGIGLLDQDQYSDAVYELYHLKTAIFRSLGDLNNAIGNQTQLISLVERRDDKAKLSESYLQLADLFIQVGQLKNAIEANQKASAQSDISKVHQVRVLLNLAKVNRMQNKLSESVQAFEQINALLDDTVPEALQADAYYQEGFTYLQMSRFDQALDSFERSQKIFSRLQQVKEAKQARLAQANALMKQGSITQAEQVFQEVLSQSSSDIALQADIYASLAFLYTELGQYSKALENSDKAEQLYRSSNQIARLPEVLNGRGLVYLRMNDFGPSEVLFLKALEENRDKNNPLLDSEITNNLGGLYKAKGDLKKARVQLIKTAELQKALGFESLLALTFNNIGSVYLEEEKYNEALDFLRQSREFASKFDLTQELAVGWNNEGILFFKQKKFSQAKNAFEKALELQKELNLRVDIARTLNNLSIIAANDKDKQLALDLLQEAIVTLSLKKLDSKVFYPNPPQDSILAAFLMKDFLQNKGAFLRDLANENKKPETRNQFLEAAYLSFDLSINLIESLRSQIKSEASQQLLLQTNIDIYHQMISILYELGKGTQNKEYHQKAFFYAEKSRARSFLDQLQEQAARESLKLPKEIQELEKKLEGQISLIDKNIFTELSKPEYQREEKRIEQWQIEKTKLQYEYGQLTKELEEKYPEYANLRYPTVYGLKEVRANLLDEQAQLIVYFLGKDASYGWRVSKEQFEMVLLPPSADIELLIKRYRKTLIDPLVFYDEEEELVIDSTNTHLVTGLQLFRTILEPLIGGTSRKIKSLLVIPDGILYYVPFEAILVQMHSQSDKRFNKGREYLINRYGVHYSPSASVVGMIQRQAENRDPELLSRRKEFVGFGDPQYRPSEDQKDSFDYNPTLKDLGFYDMPRLLATDNELKKISAMFPGAATTFLRAQAVESQAKSGISGYKYIHFATHGILDENNPEYSGIVLNLVEEDKPQDGFLQTSEIFDLKLNSDLVVLSACETGLGKVIKGEGMVGLTRSFLYAGSTSIVVSLWTVADDSTSKLMIHFYKYLNDGYKNSEALRKAKLALMQESVRGEFAYAEPFFWGPFVLNGPRF